MRWLIVVVIMVISAGCGGAGGSGAAPADRTAAATGQEQRFPDVKDVKVTKDGATYTFDVTISSPYDTAERYADGWRIKDKDGTVYGEHTLAHDHATEQPFTRTQSGVKIPKGVTAVIVEGRDQKYGYGGATKTADLPR